LDNIIWGVIVLLAAIILLAPTFTDFRIGWHTFVLVLLALPMLCTGSWFYLAKRYDPRLSSALGAAAQIMAFCAVGTPLSYLAASAGFPLQDHAFDAADKALGFDWIALYAWLNAHPTTYEVFRAIYLSIIVQAIIVILGLAFVGRLVWLRGFVLTFMCTAIITIAISAILPAEGVFSHYGLTADASSSVIPASSTSWPIFHGIRDGTYRELVAQGGEGIITFPSLHAALAVILTAGMWPISRLRWLSVPINLAMLAATPIDGSHYVMDALAGVAIAVLTLAIIHTTLRHVAAIRPHYRSRVAPSLALIGYDAAAHPGEDAATMAP
jgi:hypothetical protein